MESLAISKIRSHLLRFDGSTGPDLIKATGLSQSRVSRIVSSIKDRILVTGQRRGTRYYLRREIQGVTNPIPIYEISNKGEVQTLGNLTPTGSEGFYFEGADKSCSTYFQGLPYFLNDLRPGGFLGRLVPKRYPSWNFPDDIRFWGNNDVVRFLNHLGADLIGNLVVGDPALELALQQKPELGLKGAKLFDHESMEVLEHGLPGSSAQGEQPKFLTVNEGTSVLVKFVGKQSDDASIRSRDLLLAEQLAFRLYYNGKTPYRTRIVESNSRVYLELERFDRVSADPIFGRCGVITLESLDHQFVGSGRNWSEVARRLRELDKISVDAEVEITKRELFGRFIGNSDMHNGNISFFFDELKIKSPTPLYDMLPMRYIPRSGEIYNGNIEMPVPLPGNLNVWDEIVVKAKTFWGAIVKEKVFSKNFQQIAKGNLQKIESVERLRLSIKG